VQIWSASFNSSKESLKEEYKLMILELIPKEHWDVPEWVNYTGVEEGMKYMKGRNVKYAAQMSYHQMCRWYSGFFYKHPALKDVRYYWRVEPNVQ
jgi:mannosyltransferase